MKIVKYINNKVSFLKKIKTIINILSIVSIKKIDDTIVIDIPANLIINTTGNILSYSETGVVVLKHKFLHLQPDIVIDTKEDTLEGIVDKAYDKKILYHKMNTFKVLLKNKKIYDKKTYIKLLANNTNK